MKENELEYFEEDIWRLMEDFPHPKLVIGKYTICVEGNDDYDEHYELYEDNVLTQCFEIPQNLIDYFNEIGFNWRDSDYIILPEED